MPSVENLILWTQTEAISKKMKKMKKKIMEKGAVCLQRRSRNNPSGPHKCRSPLPFGNVSSRSLSNFSRAGCPAAALWLAYLVILTLRSAHAWQIVDRMPQGIGRHQEFAFSFLFFFFSKDTFLSLCTRDKKINRALFDRRTASRPGWSPARFEGLMPSRPWHGAWCFLPLFSAQSALCSARRSTSRPINRPIS